MRRSARLPSCGPTLPRPSQPPQPDQAKSGHRSLLALVALAPVAASNSPFPAAPNPDAALIAACLEHRHSVQTIKDTGDESLEGPVWAAFDHSFDVLNVVPAMTMDGLVAKAELIRWKAIDQFPDDPAGGAIEEWTWSLVNDLLRITAA